MIAMLGSLYLTDNKDLICRSITDPTKIQRSMALSMDEQSSELENMFPGYVMKATILLPPPSAVFREIDGDYRGFVDEYIGWLNSEMVTDYISSVLLMVYQGINTMIYIPSFSEDSVWVNTLLEFFEKTYGLHIGTSAENGFRYDNNFDINVLNTMYYHNCINELQYLSGLPIYYNEIPSQIWSKLAFDLMKYGGRDEDAMSVYNRIRRDSSITHSIVRPAVMFDFD